MSIRIPLSVFSKKIITKQYGERNPIIVEIGTPLYAQLFLRSRGNASITHALESELTESLCFHLPDSPIYQTHALRLRVGDAINSFHRRQLNDYIRRREAAGTTNITAIHEFCTAYNICIDIDIAFDALIRDYRRKKNKNFIEKNNDFFVLKTTKTGRSKCRKKIGEKLNLVHYSDSELDSLIENYYSQNAAYFKRIRDGQDLKLMKHKLVAFIYRYCAQRSVSKVCEKLNIPKNAKYRVHRYAKAFSNHLHTLPPIID